MADLVITEQYDKVSSRQNLELYDVLTEKMKIPTYIVRPSGQIKTLEAGRNQFRALSVGEQCMALANILQLFRNNGVANLSLIGGAAIAGKVLASKNFDGKNSVKLIFTSVTGFYRQEVDLLTV